MTFGCYQGGVELFDLFLAYGKIFTSAEVFWFNMLYNVGDMISGVTNIVVYFLAKDYTRVVNGYTLGMEFGLIFWLFFFPVEQFLQESLEEGAEWAQDYTWDNQLHIIHPEGFNPMRLEPEFLEWGS